MIEKNDVQIYRFFSFYHYCILKVTKKNFGAVFWTKKLSSKFVRFQKEIFHSPCDQHLWDLNPTFGIEIEMCCHINIYFMGKWWDNDLSDFCDKRTQWVKIISERVFLFENFLPVTLKHYFRDLNSSDVHSLKWFFWLWSIFCQIKYLLKRFF